MAFAVPSYLAPGGQWTNELFGAPMWLENDPGGWYVTGASELFISSEPVFPGHPGLPLQLLLNGIQRLGYWASDESTSLFGYVVRHLYDLYFVSKISVILLHLLSFFLLFRVSRRLGLNTLAAKLATLAYATTFPVLYYANRISVEPFVMVSFFATLNLMFLAADESLPNKRRWVLAFAAGACAAMGALSKAHLMAAFPLVPLAFFWCSGQSRPAAEGKTGWIGAGIGVASVLFLSMLVWNWPSFLGLWREQVGPSTGVIERLFDWSWLPGALTSAGARAYWFEVGFFLVGAIGCYRLLRNELAPYRSRFRWAFFYGLLTLLVWAFRVLRAADFHGFHYLFILIGVLAMGFGHALALMLERWTASRWRVMVGALFILTIHALSLMAAFETKRRDTVLFGEREYFRQALEELPADQRIAVIGNGYIDLVALSGLSDSYSPLDGRAALVRTFEACFLPVRRAQFDRERLIDHLKRQRVAYVIDLDRPRSEVVRSFDEWRR